MPSIYGVYACICVDDDDDDDNEGIVIVDRVLVTTFCTVIAPSELTVLLSMIMAGVAK